PKTTKAAAEFKKLEAEFMGKVQKAPPADRKELFNTYAGKFLKLAEDNKTDPAALDALSYPLRMGPPHDAKAVAALKDHVKSPNIAKLVPMLASRTDEATAKLVQAIIDENPNKKVAAQVVVARIEGLDEAVTTAKRIRDNKQTRDAYTKFYGEQ